MEDTTQVQPQPVAQQPNPDKPTGLMPGQEHEDELDYAGAALIGLAKRGLEWIKQFFPVKS